MFLFNVSKWNRMWQLQKSTQIGLWNIITERKICNTDDCCKPSIYSMNKDSSPPQKKRQAWVSKKLNCQTFITVCQCYSCLLHYKCVIHWLPSHSITSFIWCSMHSFHFTWQNLVTIEWPSYKFKTVINICDVIKQSQSEVGNIDFKIEPNKAENVFCFLLFLTSFIRSYLWNQLTNFNGVFCKM